jgi:hypothetical protein
MMYSGCYFAVNADRTKNSFGGFADSGSSSSSYSRPPVMMTSSVKMQSIFFALSCLEAVRNDGFENVSRIINSPAKDVISVLRQPHFGKRLSK